MNINNIFLNLETLKESKNFIYGDGWNARHMYEIFQRFNIPIKGFIKVYNDIVMIDDIPVVALDEVIEMKANILITQNNWQDLFDKLLESVSAERLFILANWKESEQCIVCGSDKTMEAGAGFVPFLQERMFNNHKKETAMVHCCKCGIIYSKYRPTDEEMARLYVGYRNEEYQKTRQKHEPNYTVEFNSRLSDPKDEVGRKKAIYNFINNNVDVSKVNTVLDFGGDKGQFIPDEFADRRRIVYEISGTEVLEGIELITDDRMLQEIHSNLILCNMVLEHVSNVKQYFENLVSLMEEDSYLYIEVPYARWCVDREDIKFHEHISFFDNRTFSILAENANVSTVKIEHDATVIRALFSK